MDKKIMLLTPTSPGSGPLVELESSNACRYAVMIATP
jgi:hypothetical protein